MTNPNSFGSRATLEVAGRRYTIYRLDSLESRSNGNSTRLPVSLKILLENLLRNEDGRFVKASDIDAMANWDVKGRLEKEIAFRTARVLLSRRVVRGGLDAPNVALGALDAPKVNFTQTHQTGRELF